MGTASRSSNAARSAPARLLDWTLSEVTAEGVTVAWQTDVPAAAEVLVQARGAERRERVARSEETRRHLRLAGLPLEVDVQVRVVLDTTAASPWLHVVLGDGAEGAQPAVVTRSGIDVVPDGTPGVDFVVEPRWHDQSQDDRVTLWLRSKVQLTLRRNALRDTDPLGGKPTAAATIRYKLDRDEQAGAYVRGNEGPINGAEHLAPIDLRREQQPDGSKVL